MDWKSLTDGLIGSVLGAVVTFSLAVATIRHGKLRDEARDTERHVGQEEARRHAGVAKVIGSLQGLVTEIRGFPFLGGQATAATLQATMFFYLGEHARHPNVAAWMLHQYEVYEGHLGAWRRWWRPRKRAHALTAAGDQIGEVVATLILWTSDQLNEADFADEARPAAALAMIGRERKQLALTPTASRDAPG